MIYTIGETVIDIIIKDMQPQALKVGGSALNTAISLGRLESKVSFVSEVGNDEFGNYSKNFLQKNNVQTACIVTNASRKTSISIAMLNEFNDASYQFYKDLPVAFNAKNIQFTIKDIVLFSSSFAISKRARPQISAYMNSAKINGSLIMYDPNMRKQISKGSEEYSYIIENFTKADIVRASDEDCLHIFGALDSRKIFKQLQSYGVSVFILTKNSGGVEIFTQKCNTNFEVPEIVPLSTIGAGDTFNAGILYAVQNSNLPYTEISELPRTFWEHAIPFAISCSTAVCCSLENYLSSEDVKKVLS